MIYSFVTILYVNLLDRKFVNLSVTMEPYHLLLYTEWGRKSTTASEHPSIF